MGGGLGKNVLFDLDSHPNPFFGKIANRWERRGGGRRVPSSRKVYDRERRRPPNRRNEITSPFCGLEVPPVFGSRRTSHRLSHGRRATPMVRKLIK